MKKIYILTDYLKRFGSKHNDDPYLSGMDKYLLGKSFSNLGYECEFIGFSEVDFSQNWDKRLVIYTSQEDDGYYYKSYIEDIVYALKLKGAINIPEFKWLRANNNKVLMEILRNMYDHKNIKTLSSRNFGCKEELISIIDQIEFPVVLKTAEGAMSSGVFLAKTANELIKKVDRLTSNKRFFKIIKEQIRFMIYKGYQKESWNRRKFIVQEFLPNLKNDWKILIFGDIYYIFERRVRKNDFRASGSGQDKYMYGSACEVPDGILNYAYEIYNELNVPNLSIDICMSNAQYHLIEMQALYFGTVGHERADICYQRQGSKFVKINNSFTLEELYSKSIVNYID